MARRNSGEEAEGADVDAEDGGFGAIEIADRAQHSAIAPEDENDIGGLGEGGDAGKTFTFETGETGGGFVGQDGATSFLNQAGGAAHGGGAGGLIEIGDEANFADLFKAVFQAGPKTRGYPQDRSRATRCGRANGGWCGRRPRFRASRGRGDESQDR